MTVAVEPADARALLGDDTLRWPSGRTVCADLALDHRRGDPFIVSDLDESGWAERYTAADKTLAPNGQELVQAQMPIRPGESAEPAGARLDTLLDLGFPDRDQRIRWQRRLVMDGRAGSALRGRLGERDRGQPARAQGRACASVAPSRIDERGVTGFR